jgi:hypothetical protein
MANGTGCAFLKKLRWKKQRGSGGVFLPAGGSVVEFSYAPVGRPRAKNLLKAFGVAAAPPRPGRYVVLGRCNGTRYELHNKAGRFTVEKMGSEWTPSWRDR